MVEETTDHEKCLMQNAQIVEMNVKYHSNQKRIDLFIAENVSRIINQSQEEMAVDLEVMVAVDLAVDLEVMAETEVLDLVEETTDHEKCLMQNVVIVEMIAKYHSNQKRTDLFIAENVSRITDKIS
jgi:hypothetical protein